MSFEVLPELRARTVLNITAVFKFWFVMFIDLLCYPIFR